MALSGSNTNETKAPCSCTLLNYYARTTSSTVEHAVGPRSVCTASTVPAKMGGHVRGHFLCLAWLFTHMYTLEWVPPPHQTVHVFDWLVRLLVFAMCGATIADLAPRATGASLRREESMRTPPHEATWPRRWTRRSMGVTKGRWQQWPGGTGPRMEG